MKNTNENRKAINRMNACFAKHSIATCKQAYDYEKAGNTAFSIRGFMGCGSRQLESMLNAYETHLQIKTDNGQSITKDSANSKENEMAKKTVVKTVSTEVTILNLLDEANNLVAKAGNIAKTAETDQTITLSKLDKLHNSIRKMCDGIQRSTAAAVKRAEKAARKLERDSKSAGKKTEKKAKLEKQIEALQAKLEKVSD